MRAIRLAIAALALTMAALSHPLNAQDSTAQSQRRQVPRCAAAMCEESTAIVAALDTLLRHESACAGAPPVVFRTLHLTPFTDLGDGAMGRRPVRIGVPTSPPVARMEDYGVNPFLTYWSDIRIVGVEEIGQGTVQPGTCLFVFSPVTWLGEDRARLVVVESRERPEHIAQRFVYLRRVDDRWIVTRVETGVQS